MPDGDDSREGRANTTRLEMRVTLVVALITALAGLGGVAVGGWFTYRVAEEARVADQALSRSEFLRNQRQAAYSSFLAEAFELGRLQGAYFLAIQPGSTTQSSAGQAELDQLRALSAALAKVDILGSPRARSAASELVSKFLAQHNFLINLAIALPNPVSEADGRKRQEATGVLSGLETAFQKAAAADVQARDRGVWPEMPTSVHGG